MFDNQQLKKLILPLCIEQGLAVLVGAMDVIMVSQVGEFATSGVSLVDQITVLLVQAFSAMASGGSVIAANYIGKQQPEKASEAAVQLLLANTLIGILLMTGCVFGREFILDGIYGTIEADVKDSAMIYFLITSLSYPFFAIYAGGAALCRAEGNSKVTMKVSLIANVINVGGNALLVMGLHMGTAGVAIPTLVCRIFGAAAMIVILNREAEPIHFVRGQKIRFDGVMIRKILKIGIPTGIDGSMFQIGKILVASLISTLGTASIAANAVTNTLSNIVMIPGLAMGMAMVPVVGQCIGAGRVEEARKNIRKIMIWAHFGIGTAGLLIGGSCTWLLRLFNLGPEAYEISRRLVILYACLATLYWPESFALPNALRAGGDATFLMIVTMSSMFLFRIASSYLFVKVFQWGLYGVWIAMYIDWIGRSVPFLLRLRSGKWIRLLEKKE